MPFTPGLKLSGLLYRDVVQPLLARHFPRVRHTAALIGPGSEVLGFDTARSTDHDWGPRLQLFLTQEDLDAHGAAIADLLASRMPPTIAGYPTNLVPPATVAELGQWLTARLGFDPTDKITTTDWLSAPTQLLAELTSGAIFHEDLPQLRAVRQRLAWYPDDVWRYVLACQWQRLSEEEPFVGRCAEAGDDLGSAMVAGRLVRDLMRLCLLLDRRYPPYNKWLGSAFASLRNGEQLRPVLTAALTHDHETHLATAYESVAALHNACGLTDPIDARTRLFHDRPYRVLHAERFAQALVATIKDRALRALPMTGAIDQLTDNVALLGNAKARRDTITAAVGRCFT